MYPINTSIPSVTVPARSKKPNTPTFQEWPLQEYEEKRIMNALQHNQQQLSPFSSSEDEYDEEDDDSPISSYFSNRAIFQLNTQPRRPSLPNSLRCSICQRRFHSQGNLSNHTQLYH